MDQSCQRRSLLVAPPGPPSFRYACCCMHLHQRSSNETNTSPRHLTRCVMSNSRRDIQPYRRSSRFVNTFDRYGSQHVQRWKLYHGASALWKPIHPTCFISFSAGCSLNTTQRVLTDCGLMCSHRSLKRHRARPHRAHLLPHLRQQQHQRSRRCPSRCPSLRRQSLRRYRCPALAQGKSPSRSLSRLPVPLLLLQQR